MGRVYHISLKGSHLSPAVIQLLVGFTSLLMVIRFVLDALRLRSSSLALRNALVLLDGFTLSMVHYTMGVMQHPSATNNYYQVWAVLLVTLRYSVKIGRPSGIAFKQTPFVDLMSSFWAANLLRSQATTILKISSWLLWCINSARIIQGFVSSERATKSHRKNVRLLTEYMRNEHERGDREALDPTTMRGYRYLVLGEAKQKMETIPPDYRLELTIIEEKKLVTLEKVWGHNRSHRVDVELKDMCLSFALYKLLRRRFYNLPIHELGLDKTKQLALDGILGGDKGSAASERAFRVTECELAFLNDFFHSRHALVFAKGFPFLRLLLSTLLVGAISYMAFAVHAFSKVANQDELGRIYHGVIFTWIILALLGVKEIWEVVSYVFSDWTKVLLLCKYVEQPWWLRGRVMATAVKLLCRFTLFPRWHGKIGQVNLLLGASARRPLRCVGPYPICTRRRNVALPKQVKQTLVNSLSRLGDRPVDSYLQPALSQITNDELRLEISEVASKLHGNVVNTILVWHTATSYCELSLAARKDIVVKRFQSMAGPCIKESKLDGETWSHYLTAVSLSQYCAYLPTMPSPLLPCNALIARLAYQEAAHEVTRVRMGCHSSNQVFKQLETMAMEYTGGSTYQEADEPDDTFMKMGLVLGQKLMEAEDRSNNDDKDEAVWKFLAEFWAGFVLYLAASTRAAQHKTYLRFGGELMTHLWALMSHAGFLGNVAHGHHDLRTPFERSPDDPVD